MDRVVTDGTAVDPTVRSRPPSSGSNSSRTRGALEREATEGGGRRTETVKAPATVMTGGLRLGKEGGGTRDVGRRPETEKIGGVARTEIGRPAPTGVRVVKEIGDSVRRVADETCDRNGLT